MMRRAISARPPTQAVTLWHLAAENGHAASQYSLGNSCFRGAGMNIDMPLAETWFRKAAAQGRISLADTARQGVLFSILRLDGMLATS